MDIQCLATVFAAIFWPLKRNGRLTGDIWPKISIWHFENMAAKAERPLNRGPLKRGVL